MARPWQSPVPPLSSSVEETVLFPADNEDTGVVRVAWRGPDWADQQTIAACEVLWECVARGGPRGQGVPAGPVLTAGPAVAGT